MKPKYELRLKFILYFCVLKIEMMTNIALKINERTKSGKTLLSLIKSFTDKNNGVEIYDIPNFETVKAMYDAENKIKTTKSKNSKDLFNKLGI